MVSIFLNSINLLFASSLFTIVLRLISQFAHLYCSSPSFSEVFWQVPRLLKALHKDSLSPGIGDNLTAVISELEDLMEKAIRSRTSFDLRIKKPATIKQLTPKFTDKYRNQTLCF
jgi:hypothetical protein